MILMCIIKQLYIYIRTYPPGYMDAAVKMHGIQSETVTQLYNLLYIYVATYIFLALIPYTDLRTYINKTKHSYNKHI